MNKRTRQLLIVYLLAVVVYLVLVFTTKPTPLILKTFDITKLKYWVVITIAEILITIAWAIAFYGFNYLYKYALTIKDHAKNGRSINRLAIGLGILVFQLPVTSLVSEILSRIAAHNPGFISASTITSHYVSMAPPLIAFLFVGYGARGLTETVKQRPSQRATNGLAISFIVIGALYTFLVFKVVPNSLVGSSTNLANYYLPNWLLLFTLVIPYIFTWFIGLLAAYEVYLYAFKSPGIIYRQALKLLALGLGWTIVVSVLTQYITSLTRVKLLKINALLIFIYSLLILLAVGYLFVAWGAKKLQRIEEV